MASQVQPSGAPNPFAVRCIIHPMNRFVPAQGDGERTGETRHCRLSVCVGAHLSSTVTTLGDDCAADRKKTGGQQGRGRQSAAGSRMRQAQESSSQICQLAIIEATTFFLCGAAHYYICDSSSCSATLLAPPPGRPPYGLKTDDQIGGRTAVVHPFVISIFFSKDKKD